MIAVAFIRRIIPRGGRSEIAGEVEHRLGELAAPRIALIRVGRMSTATVLGAGPGSSLVDDHPVEQPGVERGDARASTGRPTAAGTPPSAPSPTWPRDQRADRDHRRRRSRAIASRIPAVARIGPIEITGFEGPTITASAAAIASSTSGVGVAASMPDELDPLDRRLRR